MMNSFDPHVVFLKATTSAEKFPGKEEKALGKKMVDTSAPVKENIEAKEKLVLGNMQRVLFVASRYSKTSADKEDLAQTLSMQLFERAEEYDPSNKNNAAFGTFAQMKLFSWASNHARKEGVRKTRLGQQSDMPENGIAEESQEPLYDGSSDYTIDDMQLIHRGMKKLERINPEWHEVVEHFFGIQTQSISAKEIGKKFGISKQMVLLKLQSALRHLTAMIELEQKVHHPCFTESLKELADDHEERGEIIEQLIARNNENFTVEKLAKAKKVSTGGALRKIQKALKDMCERIDIVYNPFENDDTYDLTQFKHRGENSTPHSEESRSS